MKRPKKKTGGNGDAALELSTQSVRDKVSLVNTYGTDELCAWRCWPGICRFQTTSPEFARKLSQRSKAQLVGYSVSNAYLRVFQEKIEPWRAKHLVTRYIKAANGAFSSRDGVASASEPGGKITIASTLKVSAQ